MGDDIITLYTLHYIAACVSLGQEGLNEKKKNTNRKKENAAIVGSNNNNVIYYIEIKMRTSLVGDRLRFFRRILTLRFKRCPK